MRFRIPFTIANTEKLKRISRFFITKTKKKKPEKESNLKQYLDNADSGLTPEEYKAITKRSFLLYFFILYVIATTTLILLRIKSAYLLSLGLVFLFSIFIFFSQTAYPKVYDK